MTSLVFARSSAEHKGTLGKRILSVDHEPMEKAEASAR